MMLSTRLAVSALILSGLAAPALAQDIQLELVNDSGLTLMEFYTSLVDEGTWGDDMLGADVIAPGEADQVTLADGSAQCGYDLRFVFEDGTEMTDSVDACEMASYTITP